MISKEDFIKCTNEDEVFAVFHSILARINEKRRAHKQKEYIILNKEIGEAIEWLLMDYQGLFNKMLLNPSPKGLKTKVKK